MPVADSSETLKIGDAAPAFTLSAANEEKTTSLSDLVRSGPAVIEFLRGTW